MGTGPPGKPGTGGDGVTFTSVGRPAPSWAPDSAPMACGIAPGGGGGSIPMARIRARCVAAWVFAQGKSGPVGKYWTSSCI
jgi:hypothetical protein